MLGARHGGLRRMVNRRHLLGGAAAAAGGLTGCAFGRRSDGAGGGDLLSKTREPATLTYASWETGTGWEAVKRPIEAFMQEYPHIRVEADNLGGSGSTTYDEKLRVLIAAGTGADVYKMGSAAYIHYYLLNALLDLTDRIARDPEVGKKGYFVEPLETERQTIKGRRYAMGTAWQIHHLFYNRQALQSVGVPFPSNDPERAWTWAELLEYARRLTVDRSGRPTTDAQQVHRWGLYWGPVINTPIFSNGGEFIAERTRRFTLDQPAEYEVVQEVADLVLKHRVAPTLAELQGIAVSPAQALADGRLALLLEGNWVTQQTAQFNPPARQWMGTAVPPIFKRPATWTGSSYQGIWSGTQKPDYAWLLVRTIMAEKYQLEGAATGQYGPLHGTAVTPEGLKRWLNPNVYPEGYEQLYLKFQPKYGHLVPHAVPGYNLGWPVVNQALQEVFAGQRQAREALREAVPRANQLLQEEEQRTGFTG
ncbi:MAG TPA: extracellular solute-binding protein [Chloroflexota bacterium]|nr:extracellular solute-binding protein [Chloroflexota bacterium]